MVIYGSTSISRIAPYGSIRLCMYVDMTHMDPYSPGDMDPYANVNFVHYLPGLALPTTPRPILLHLKSPSSEILFTLTPINSCEQCIAQEVSQNSDLRLAVRSLSITHHFSWTASHISANCGWIWTPYLTVLLVYFK